MVLESVCVCDSVYVYLYCICIHVRVYMYTDICKTAATVIGQGTNGLRGLLSWHPTASDGLWKQGEQSGQAACALQVRGVSWRSLCCLNSLSTAAVVWGKLSINVMSTFIAANAYTEVLPHHRSALPTTKVDFFLKRVLLSKGALCVGWHRIHARS